MQIKKKMTFIFIFAITKTIAFVLISSEFPCQNFQKQILLKNPLYGFNLCVPIKTHEKFSGYIHLT